MNKEMEGLRQKGTFGKEILPSDRKAIKTRFVYNIKRTAQGAVERYKARLVARGFTQHEGVDFFQTFSPVVGYDTLRAVLSVAAYRGWNIDALDFTQAYLNATLKEDVWLELPDGEIVKANKSIYGLKQSAMEWYKELRGTILAEGWGSSAYDECLYYRESNDGRIAILTSYVDDTLFTGDFTEEIARMRKRLLEMYEGRDPGTPDKLVGVRITIRKDGITLH
ncbi:unnamed protein product [Discosporangium mesarthrocarpum]